MLYFSKMFGLSSDLNEGKEVFAHASVSLKDWHATYSSSLFLDPENEAKDITKFSFAAAVIHKGWKGLCPSQASFPRVYLILFNRTNMTEISHDAGLEAKIWVTKSFFRRGTLFITLCCSVNILKRDSPD